jgi:hypothetical protein
MSIFGPLYHPVSSRPTRSAHQRWQESETCVICLEPLNSKPVVELGCKHINHMECIVGGIEAGKLTCPECRVPIESPPQLAVRVSQYQQTHQMSRDNFRAPEENYEHNIAPYESDAGEEQEDEDSDSDSRSETAYETLISDLGRNILRTLPTSLGYHHIILRGTCSVNISRPAPDDWESPITPCSIAIWCKHYVPAGAVYSKYQLELEVSVHNLEPPVGSIHFEESLWQPDNYIPYGFDTRLRIVAEGQNRWISPNLHGANIQYGLHDIIYAALLRRKGYPNSNPDGLRRFNLNVTTQTYTVQDFTIEPQVTYLEQTVFPTEEQNWDWVQGKNIARTI